MSLGSAGPRQQVGLRLGAQTGTWGRTYGRPSLALDLLEEFRAPLLDRFSAKLLNLGILSAADFVSSPQGGVYLGQEGKKRYFAAYEAELEEPFALAEGEGGGDASGDGEGTADEAGGEGEVEVWEASSSGSGPAEGDEPAGGGQTTFRRLSADRPSAWPRVEVVDLGVLSEDPEVYIV